jgi:ligand-binding sensor domain-containing protein
VVVMSNDGGSYHVINTYSTGGTSGLPRRYITGISVNALSPTDAYISFSGYSRNWYVGAVDPGVGHVFEINGSTVSDRTGNLIDSPATDILLVNGDLVAGTDFGVYASKDNGSNWSRLGANLPNVVVDQLTVADDGRSILAATHGRGLWTYPVSSLP